MTNVHLVRHRHKSAAGRFLLWQLLATEPLRHSPLRALARGEVGAVQFHCDGGMVEFHIYLNKADLGALLDLFDESYPDNNEAKAFTKMNREKMRATLDDYDHYPLSRDDISAPFGFARFSSKPI